MAENLPFLDLIDPRANVYAESGYYYGVSLDEALTLPQFNTLYSIELSKDLFALGKMRYNRNDRVKLLHGDSAQRLGDVLAEIEAEQPESRVVFFGDGHWSGAETAMADVASPIKAELETLVKYKHLIIQVIYDDVLAAIEADAGTPIPPESQQYRTGWIGLSQIKQYLAEINPKFNVHVDMARRVYGLLYTTLD